MTASVKEPLKFDSAEVRSCFEGLLLGTAVGDALGLPAENLSPERIRKLWRGEWRMRFLLGRGMMSDDTEHTLMVAQALLAYPDDVGGFRCSLAWKLRWWFTGLPGGVGLATARACIRLWLGFPPDRSGVVSGGSGPAMRSAIIGAFFANDDHKRREYVLASSRLTHRGWQAETAALAVAEAAVFALTNRKPLEVSSLLLILRDLCSEQEWQTRLSEIETSLARNDSVAEFVRVLGLEKGVSGYALHVVPVALYAWLRHPGDFRSALVAALECGGDTDTVGAILGALYGAGDGAGKIPKDWVDAVAEWPRSISFMRIVAERLATQSESTRPLGAVQYFWPALLVRNLMFLVVVLLHGFRRLLPPY